MPIKNLPPSLSLLLLLTWLATSCTQNERAGETCENFQVFGLFYPEERLHVTVNSTVIYTDSFPQRTRLVNQRFCLVHPDTFTVQVRLTRGEKILIDTAMRGYTQQEPHVLVVPLGKPRQPIQTQSLSEEQKAALISKIYHKTPKDSLIRTAFLERGLL